MENLEPTGTGTGDWELGTGNEFSQSRHLLSDAGRQERSGSPVPNHATCFLMQGDKNAVAPQYPITSEDAATSKAQLILYLIPVLGFFPSLWTLYRRQGSREQLAVSRLSITLASAWLLGYLLLATGAATSDLFTLRLFILDSFLTSSYFLVSVWLIIRLLQGKSKRLPGFSSFAEHKVGKYLS